MNKAGTSSSLIPLIIGVSCYSFAKLSLDNGESVIDSVAVIVKSLSAEVVFRSSEEKVKFDWLIETFVEEGKLTMTLVRVKINYSTVKYLDISSYSSSSASQSRSLFIF